MVLRARGAPLLFGHLQPPLDKNSEDLATLILKFDDIAVKTIYSFLSSLEWGPERGIMWIHVFNRPCSRPFKIFL